MSLSTLESLGDDDAATLEARARDIIYNITDHGFATEAPVEETVEQLWAVVEHCIEYAAAGRLAGDFPIQALEDIFDTQSIRACELLFGHLEAQRKTIIEHMGKGSVLLRFCNELLRRLSKTKDTVFCGRILIFLSTVFPLSERSAVNLRGEYNTDNVTVFKPDDEAAEEPSVYATFWSLQSFFCNPALLQESAQLAKFFEAMKTTLDKFDTQAQTNSTDMGPMKADETDHFFTPKFLTAPELLDLELSDVTFRKHICVQALIIIRHLGSFSADHVATNKSFQSTFKPTGEEMERALALDERVRKYLTRQPEGIKFLAAVDAVLKSDTQWLRWKAISCPPYDKAPLRQAQLEAAPAKLATVTALPRPYRYTVGNANLSKVWQEGGSWDQDALRSYASRPLPGLNDYAERATSLEAELAQVQGFDDQAEQTRTQLREQIAMHAWLALRQAKDYDIRKFTGRVAGGHLSAYLLETAENEQGRDSHAVQNDVPQSSVSGAKRPLDEADMDIASPEKRAKTEMNVSNDGSRVGISSS